VNGWGEEGEKRKGEISHVVMMLDYRVLTWRVLGIPEKTRYLRQKLDFSPIFSVH